MILSKKSEENTLKIDERKSPKNISKNDTKILKSKKEKSSQHRILPYI
jgi:hypothetical protein